MSLHMRVQCRSQSSETHCSALVDPMRVVIGGWLVDGWWRDGLLAGWWWLAGLLAGWSTGWRVGGWLPARATFSVVREHGPQEAHDVMARTWSPSTFQAKQLVTSSTRQTEVLADAKDHTLE